MAKFFARFYKVPKTRRSDTEESRSTFEVGSVINQRYWLEAELGRGGMGIVYRARDIPNDRDVAIKIINADQANALTLGQFNREAELGAQLKHPHIVSIYETGTVDTSRPYLVMELVQGVRLDDIHNFTYARVIDIAIQICDTLQYMHDRGIVYRDLKPGNVFLEKRGFHYFVKLMDFGLAHRRGEAYGPNESNLAGTVFYLAPELIAGQPADVGSDLYALGATLYEMVTGRVPFSNLDEQNILTQHVEEAVSPPRQSHGDMPTALEGVILRLLEKKPEDRFASAEDVKKSLEQIILKRDIAVSDNLSQVKYVENEIEIVEVIHLLQANRLVTLLNNRENLAFEVGSQLRSQFVDGVWVLDFESIGEPAKIMQVVASTLGIQPMPNRPLTVSIVEKLRQKELLLLLIHCDRFVGAVVQFVETILKSCPEIYFLVVNPAPLNIQTEQCYPG